MLCILLMMLLVTAGCDSATTANKDDPGTRVTPAPDGSPQPDGNDRIFLDTRQTLQRAQNVAQADCVLKSIPLSACTATGGESQKVGFATNMDGQGTRALRFSWSRASSCIDDGLDWPVRLGQGPYPRRLFIQWKQRMGRTPTGGGLGALDSFDITNQNCGNAGRKVVLVLRDVPDQGSRNRFDYLWQGPAPIGVTLGFQPLNKGIRWDPQDEVGKVITQTLYLQAESAAGAKNGIARLWVNGTLLFDHTSMEIGPEAFQRFQFPSTFRAPIQDQTEYWWDILAWEPIG